MRKKTRASGWRALASKNCCITGEVAKTSGAASLSTTSEGVWAFIKSGRYLASASAESAPALRQGFAHRSVADIQRQSVSTRSIGMTLSTPRHDWTLPEVEALFALPFTELVFQAASVHREWFDPAEVQRSQL